MKYTVSIGIATRNRQLFANQTIRQVYALGADVQIVISDNSEDDSLRSMIGDLLDQDRVKLIYTPQRISVVENYDLTAQHADGEFYLCIGDDDLVLDQVLELAAWMDQNGMDAARTSRGVTYIWPGATSRFGRVAIEKVTGNCHMFSAEDGVIKVLKQGCQGYITTDMAGSYHALVRMGKMREVFEKTGYYFSGFSPDIYSATCLSLLPGIRCISIDFPVSIPGSCALSATNRGSKNTAVSTVEAAIQRYGKTGYQWEELNVQYYTPETTWADTMMKAVRAMDREDLLDAYFNRAFLVNLVHDRWAEKVPELENLFTEEERSLLRQNTGLNTKDYCHLSTVGKIRSRLRGEVRDMFFVKDNIQAYKRIEHFLNSKNRREKWKNFKGRKIL